MAGVRRLTVVLGDQLDLESSAFRDFDSGQDIVWMAEVKEESTHVPSHKARTAYFLSAMRHFAEAARAQGRRVEYRQLDATGNKQSLSEELRQAIRKFRPQQVVMVEPGEYRLEIELSQAVREAGVALDVRPDESFFCSRAEFNTWAQKHSQLRMEFFYRDMRKKTRILMQRDGQPSGGAWNYDTENRRSFGKQGPPPLLHPPRGFPPDKITQDVLKLVARVFPDNPGSIENFDFPVTAKDGQVALTDFIVHRLPHFGTFQDAMWKEEPYLFHSRISGLMNLKLLNPRKVLTAVQDSYERGDAPLASVEGFVRQILGWREYIRGVYWLKMPQYVRENALRAGQELPDFYWTGETDMNCLQQAVGQTLKYGYAHHIQRLMVTGLFSLLFGVKPVEIHKWYLAIYWDAVEWVEMPNVLGMSQYADSGAMASKPYVATGKYIQRMSNYCKECRYKPDVSTGDDACPFTTLYWDFLLDHQELLQQNQRMQLQVRNLDRMDKIQRAAIREQAATFRASLPKGHY